VPCLAAIVPGEYEADLAEDLADALAAQESLAEAGDNVPREKVKAEAPHGESRPDPVGGHVGAAEPAMPPFGTRGSDLPRVRDRFPR
jgi:hypothetical protein